MGLQNNKRIERKRNRDVLRKHSKRQKASDLDSSIVGNVDLTDETSPLPEGQFQSEDTETRDQLIAQNLVLQDLDKDKIPLNYDGSNPTINLQNQNDFQSYLNKRAVDESNSNKLQELIKKNPNIFPTVDTDNALAMVNKNPISFSNMGRNVELSATERARQSIIESVGKEPTLDEAQLKRAKTQALVNAFGNLLQAGVGFGTMQGGGYFQAKPIDNTQVLANLEGVHDKYYKEMADYRDAKSKSKLALANLDLQQFEREQQIALDKEKENVRQSERAEDVAFRGEELQFRRDTKDDEFEFKRKEADRRYELNLKQLNQSAERLNLDKEKFIEAQLQSDRQLGAIYEKADRDERIAMEGFFLKREELDQIIRRNDNSEISNGINLTTEGFESLNDSFPNMDYVQANIALNSYVTVDGVLKDLKGNTIEDTTVLAEYETSKKYVSEYNKLLNTQNQLINRMNLQKQEREGVDVSDPSKVDIKDDKFMKALSSDVIKEFKNTSPEFNNKMFGEGKALKGDLNATNIEFAINYLENPDNVFDIQQGFGWKDDEAVKKREDLVVKLIILQKRAEAIEKGTSSTE